MTSASGVFTAGDMQKEEVLLKVLLLTDVGYLNDSTPNAVA